MPKLLNSLISHLIIGMLVVTLLVSNLVLNIEEATAASSRRVVQPQNGAPILSGNIRGEEWLSALPDSKIAFCNEAYSAFRSSPSQSYIISSNVQSLTASGLCDRIDQYFSIEENLESRLGTAAAIAPLLFADTPLGTKYSLPDQQ